MKKPNELIKEWFKQADDDLKYAQVGFDETELFSNVCFSCQQAFEKYLKGYLLLHNVDFPRIHSLTKLLGLCLKLDPSFVQFKEAAEKLTPYNITTRYPDIGNVIFSKSQAKEALNYAVKLQNFIQGRLS